LVQDFDMQLVPQTVHASLLARFDRLGESRTVAQLGAAIGREFTYRLLRAVADMPDDELREHLDRLCRSELAFVQREPPDSTYKFKHALIQDAIYSTLLKKTRLQVHERVFTTLRDQFPEVVEARPELAAFHAERAGLRELALPLLKDAGMRAFARTAMAEAVKHLERAIDLVDALKEPARSSVESELQAAIGPAYMATLGWAAPEVERSSARLRDLAAAIGDGAKVFQATWGLWTVHFLRGQLDPALDLARQVLEMAGHARDPMLLVAGHHAVGYTHFYRADYADALRHADEGLASFDLQLEKVIATVFQLSSSCVMWFFRAKAQQAFGNAQKAADSLRRAYDLAEELRHPPSRAYLLCQMCNFYRLNDDVQQVKTHAAALRTLSTTEGFALWIPLADVFLAWTAAREGGHAATAVKQIEASIAFVHGSGTYLNEPDLAFMLAEILLLARRPEIAFEIVQNALRIARTGKIRHGQPELLRLQGDAARAMGKLEEAAAYYREGLQISNSTGARFFGLRCALALARFPAAANSRAELKDLLEGFTEGFDQPDYRQAVALVEGSAN
jgi:tetratricopeptide (TPR) repeat protein